MLEVILLEYEPGIRHFVVNLIRKLEDKQQRQQVRVVWQGIDEIYEPHYRSKKAWR